MPSKIEPCENCGCDRLHPPKKAEPIDFLSWMMSDRVSKDDGNGCKIWQGLHNRGGYGVVRFRGSVRNAHRVSFHIANASVDINGKEVRHLCHNRSCINPRHLAIGDRLDNSNDTRAAGRFSRANAKLTDADALALLNDWDTGGYTQKQLADKYGVSFGIANAIIRRVRYRHLKSEEVNQPELPEPTSRFVLTDGQAARLHSLYATGRYTLKALGKMFAVTAQTAHTVINGKGYRHLALRPLKLVQNRNLRKLTDDQVREIRSKRKAGMTFEAIGDWLGRDDSRGDVSWIRKIAVGQNYRHLTDWGYTMNINEYLDEYQAGLAEERTGTTLVAAKMLGRDAVGIELHEPYINIARTRLAQVPLALEPVDAEDCERLQELLI